MANLLSHLLPPPVPISLIYSPTPLPSYFHISLPAFCFGANVCPNYSFQNSYFFFLFCTSLCCMSYMSLVLKCFIYCTLPGKPFASLHQKLNTVMFTSSGHEANVSLYTSRFKNKTKLVKLF